MNSLLTLQHDGHNSIDRVNERGLAYLDRYCKTLEEFHKENPDIKIKNSADVFIAAEYLRTHIKDMRNILDNYYKSQKEDK